MRKNQFKAMVITGLMLLMSIISFGQLNYKTTWVANSGGTLSTFTQMYMIGATVNQKGITAGVCYWDEGGRGLGLYSAETGTVLNTDWNDRNGGTNVGINLNYVYNAGTSSISKRSLTNTKVAVKSVSISGISASFTEGDVAFTLEPAVADSFRLLLGITSVSANEHYVVASVYQLNKVYVYDTDLNLLRTISVNRAYYATPDNSGNVWVVQGADKNNAPKILEFDASGNATGKEITGFSDPRSLQISKKGQLIVGDNGTNQQVFFYDITGSPVLVETFGQKGGIYSGIAGEVKPDKFSGIVYAGTDSLDNLYVVTDREGAIIRRFDKDRNLLWQKYGLAFVDMAHADPYNENDIYSCEERFSMDYSKENGKEQEYKAYTYNYDKYPDDARGHVSVDGGVWIRRINGKKIMFVGQMYSEFIFIYRFNEATDGEIAIPSGAIMRHTRNSLGLYGEWPPKQPKSGSFIWRDKNGNGRMEEEEYETVTDELGFANVDDAGNIYMGGLEYFECQGLDEIGNPIYSFKNIVTSATPAPFNEIKKVVYDNERDAMYITGNTSTLSSTYNVGPVFALYRNWSKGNRTAAWVTESHQIYGGIAAKRDYLFVAYTQNENNSSIDVFSAKDGSKVGNLAPPTAMQPFGWIDIPWGANVSQRTNGEYLIFEEDDLAAKTVIYRWNPYENDNDSPTKPNALKLVSKTATSATVTFNQATDATGLSGYFFYANGVKSNVQAVSDTTYTVTGLNPATHYEIYVAAADYAGHETNSDIITIDTYPVDNSAPSKPTGFKTTNVGLSSISLIWNSSTDNVGVTGYDLFFNNERVGYKTIQDTVYIVNDLKPGTQYEIKLVAYDYAGNTSDTASIMVSTITDNEKPSTPILYTTTQRSSSEIAINWKISTDNIDVAYYDLYNKGVLLKGKIPAHEYLGIPVSGDYMGYKVTGLEPNTSYDFTLKAVDLVGNESGFSNKITLKTDSVWGQLLDMEESTLGIGYVFYSGLNMDVSGIHMGAMMSGYMEWTVDLPMDTTYRFITRYTTMETLTYPMQIEVNGENVANFSLKMLTGMTWYGYEDDPGYVIVRLKAGKSVIRLISTAQWAPNLDLMKIMVTKPFVSVTSISLDKSTVSAQKGESIQLNATVLPLDATNKAINWTSSRKATATVDANGLVTMVGTGTATITASTVDKGKYATCTVTTLTAIDETKVNDLIKIYPNPANNELFVKLAEGQSGEDVEVRLYNSLSSMVMNVKSNNQMNGGALKFDTSSLSNGVYFLQATMGNKVDTKKVIISK